MSFQKPPIIQELFPPKPTVGQPFDHEFQRHSRAATAALVLAVSGLAVAVISVIPLFIRAVPPLLFFGPLGAGLAVAGLICGIVGICATGKKKGLRGRRVAMAGTLIGVVAFAGGSVLHATSRLALRACHPKKSH